MGTKVRFWAGALCALGLVLGAASCGPPPQRTPAEAQGKPALIPRAALFGDAAREGGQLSPRGDRVAFLAPRDGVMNLWVLSVDALDDPHPVTDERQRGLRRFAWAADNATLLYLQDENGDEKWRLFAVDAGGGAPRALTPAGASAEILGVSAGDPGAVVITLDQRDSSWPDVFRVDLVSGVRRLEMRNEGYARFVLDRGGNVRLGVRPVEGGGAEFVSFAVDGSERTLFASPFEDAMTARPIAFEGDGRSFLMLDIALDHAALVRVDAETGAKTVLGESDRADVADVWVNPMTGAPEAFATEYLRREWRALNAEAQADIDFLDRQLAGDFNVVSRNSDDTRWIVVEEGPQAPARSYLYDRADSAARRLTALFRHRPALDSAALQPMTPVEIEARDGLTLVSYLTLPHGADANGDGRPEAPLPLVLWLHDGPGERDSYGFNPIHQWLANRGYGVLSVNFRGSAGFGKVLLNAGNGEWGARAREDVLDAAAWAIANGVAEPERIALAGAGFGGYAVLAGLAFSPAQFRCGVAHGAAVNLASVIERAGASEREALYRRLGDPRTESGAQALRALSPLFRAGRVRAPLLLSLGARDPRTSRAETDQAAQAVRMRGALTYLVFPEEGRELVRQENRLSYLAVVEHFLGDCLGGRVEPVGASFEGAAINVYDGAVNVPGLTAFARRLPSLPQAVAPAAPQAPVAAPVVETAPAPDQTP